MINLIIISTINSKMLCIENPAIKKFVRKERIWLGWQDVLQRMKSANSQRVSVRTEALRGFVSLAHSMLCIENPAIKKFAHEERIWLGWQDLNLRMRESKSRALPLGYTPSV